MCDIAKWNTGNASSRERERERKREGRQGRAEALGSELFHHTRSSMENEMFTTQRKKFPLGDFKVFGVSGGGGIVRVETNKRGEKNKQ